MVLGASLLGCNEPDGHKDPVTTKQGALGDPPPPPPRAFSPVPAAVRSELSAPAIALFRAALDGQIPEAINGARAHLLETIEQLSPR